jgi:hypothetical protein
VRITRATASERGDPAAAIGCGQPREIAVSVATAETAAQALIER